MDKTTRDGTMLGRIVEWMTGDIGNDFSITGGSTNRGNREKDVAIADINRQRSPMADDGLGWMSTYRNTLDL